MKTKYFTKPLLKSPKPNQEEQMAAKKERQYINRYPSKIPEGYVLCHNHVLPQRPIGKNGFRVWLLPADELNPDWELCDCGITTLPHYAAKKAVEEQKKKPTKKPAAKRTMTKKEKELVDKMCDAVAQIFEDYGVNTDDEVEDTVADYFDAYYDLFDSEGKSDGRTMYKRSGTEDDDDEEDEE